MEIEVVNGFEIDLCLSTTLDYVYSSPSTPSARK